MKKVFALAALFLQLLLTPLSATLHSLSHCHWLSAISSYADLVQLEDGSTWYVDPSDASTVSTWYSGDLLTLSPVWTAFSEYSYLLTNETQDSSAYIAPHVGPVRFGPHSHWIASLDGIQGIVVLEDGSTWIVPDGEVLEWDVNQTIILGANSELFSSYDSVLINVDMNNYVRAQEL